jgi:hypothetical protein
MAYSITFESLHSYDAAEMGISVLLFSPWDSLA